MVAAASPFSMMEQLSLLLCVFFTATFNSVQTCGPTTHIEIAYRSLYKYFDSYGSIDYDKILEKNQDALEAGSNFPDAFYPSICFEGNYHDVSEDTHWTPFTNASIHYIRKHYTQPWNKDAEKLISFLLGVVSHQVSDVSWHSIQGIPQGFLKTMSYVNYHGVYSTAHTDGDLGGDVLNLYQLDLTYSKIFGEWYMPVDDLLNIYQELYGTSKISKEVIKVCGALSYVVKIAERLAVGKYFPISAKHSPYLVNQLYDYFLGGIEDMAVWTQRIWKYITWALENGTQGCNLAFNPLLLRCNDNESQIKEMKASASLRNGFFIEPNPEILELLNEVIIRNVGKGIVFQPSKNLKRKLLKARKRQNLDHLLYKSKPEVAEKKRNKMIIEMAISEVRDNDSFGPKSTKPSAIFHTNVDYAKLGRAFAVADLDGDGNEDVVIGAPGFYSAQNQQNGMIFILFGTDNGLDTSVTDIADAASIQISGPESKYSAASQFGTSIAVVDFDRDGQLDIAVGAPSYGSTNLTYTGKVLIYSLVGRTDYTLRATVACEVRFCNLGSSLAVTDLNSDLNDDLVMGTQFAAGPGGEQKGMTSVLISDASYLGKSGIWIDVTQDPNILYGDQNYGWFGYSLEAKTSHDKSTKFLAVGEPNFRRCVNSDCGYDPSDVQAIGKVSLYSSQQGSTLNKVKEFLGDQEFAMLGTSLSLGRPFDGTSDILAISASSHSVRGLVQFVPVDLPQVGSVFLFNLSDPQQYTTVFSGDRKYGRFGAQVKFADLDRDGYDELIITAPLHTDDFTGELFGDQQGEVYIYRGGPGFPMGDATSECGPFVKIKPCPKHMAWQVLTYGENLARFGSQLAVVKSKNKVNVLVTAAHSSSRSRLGGVVTVFDF